MLSAFLHTVWAQAADFLLKAVHGDMDYRLFGPDALCHPWMVEAAYCLLVSELDPAEATTLPLGPLDFCTVS